MLSDFAISNAILKVFPSVKKSLSQTVEDTNFTNDQAVRVYLWDKNSYDVPGLTKTDRSKLLDFIKKNPKKVGAAGGLLQFRAGAAIKDALGLDVGEGFVADTAEDIATTGASTGILNRVGKWLAPKLTSVVTSKAGQKALTKFAGKQAAKNIARQVVGTTVPGWGNIAMAIAGAGLSVRDFIKFIRNYKEE